MATTPGCRLGAEEPLPISTLSLTQLIDIDGTYPQPGQGQATNVMAMIRTLAFGGPAYGAPGCEGGTLQIATHQALFSLLGISFGGDGRTDFGLPDLRQTIAVGGGPLTPSPVPETLSLTYMIAVDAPAGAAAFPMLGAIGLFAGIDPPAGWLVADGSILPLAQYVPLFEVIGTAFGGNGATIVQLPDLNGRAAIGAGQGSAESIALGQQVSDGPDTAVSGLGLNYLINVSGEITPSGGNGGFPDSVSMLGEVIAFAGANLPSGWLPCDGREMPIAGNETLFQLIGTSFGGDGETSFALPNLAANMVVSI
jgi:microcystin-dependent protein